MFNVLKKISGVAYGGGILEKSNGTKYVIDLSTLKNETGSKVFIKEEHVEVGSIGDGSLTVLENEILFDAEIFDYDDDSKRVAHQLDRGLKWKASVGIGESEAIEGFTGEVNGQYFEDVVLLKNGNIKEVSLVLFPADVSTDVSLATFHFCNTIKESKKDINKKGVKQMEFMTKAQWMEFACACGGNSSSTPRDIEKKFQDLQEDSEALQEIKEVEVELKKTEEELRSEIATLQEQIATLSAQLQEYTDAEGLEVENAIAEFSKETGMEFSKEEIEVYKANPKTFHAFSKLAKKDTFNAGEKKATSGVVKVDKKDFNADASDIVRKAKEIQKSEGVSFSQAVKQAHALKGGK